MSATDRNIIFFLLIAGLFSLSIMQFRLSDIEDKLESIHECPTNPPTGEANMTPPKLSPQQTKLFRFLAGGKPKTTLEIVRGTNICAVNTAIHHLRRKGFDIPCTPAKVNGRTVYSYRLLNSIQQDFLA